MTDHRLLIVGQGSIGLRHTQTARDLGYTVTTVSRRDGGGMFTTIDAALQSTQYDTAIIATATNDHKTDLTALRQSGFDGPVLVEKPLFVHAGDVGDVDLDNVWVGYNLRFHPVVCHLQACLKSLDEPVVFAQFHVGQYLPDWRPGRDWQDIYSADPARGGGVLRDLSHELDLAQMLFGGWRHLTALGGAISALPMSADDIWQITACMEGCPVLSIHLNCLERVPQRKIRVNTTTTSILADLISGTLSVNGDPVPVQNEGRDSYRGQLAALVEGDDRGRLCSGVQAVEVLSMIAAIEEAGTKRTWLERGGV